ncbi:MAG TPA: DUF2291 family protein [Phnomibacter sp.]|nr:DUF2291 family protein [Phnomibacter sp.]
MKKYVKYTLVLIAVLLLGYKSVYFEKLSTRKNNTTEAFDVASFSRDLWRKDFPAKMDSAVDLSVLIDAMQEAKGAAFEKYTHALAIGNYRYALIKAKLRVIEVKEDEVMAGINHHDSVLIVNAATEFIYGNAIRDASGLIQVKDYPNASDLNSISEGLNKIVRTEVLPDFKKKVKAGDNLDIVAAIELNKEHLHWHGIELLPVRIQIVP